ncbi:MAG: hypothetical protein H6Q74_1853 [Firmicutes bacterium]|nr:hypothetical protein [Bacillota bacterium]
MQQRISFILTIIFILGSFFINIYTEISLQHCAQPVQIPVNTKPNFTILLLPLDSRPPCTQFVEKLAALANVNLILPPPQLLDNYQTPGKTNELRTWLYSAIPNVDAAIISTDMLIHGGLIASRQNPPSPGTAEATIALLEACHRANPNASLYVFHIIPRLLIGGNNINPRYQALMQKYSVLKDEIYTFENQPDITELEAIEQELPPEIISNYLTLNQQTTDLSIKLIHLADQGIISSLVLGQDDGQPFGLPNVVKQKLTNYIKHYPQLTDKVFITRGTDEVALTLLGHILMHRAACHPRVLVQYSTPSAPTTIMPYMPHSVAKTVAEKLAIIGGVQTSDPQKADFILYIHIGTAHTSKASLTTAASQVKNLLDSGAMVALVDLSYRFKQEDTLLPYLIANDTKIFRLAAYAGWNTTSNSIGTALTEGALFTHALAADQTSPPNIRLYKNNLEFLAARFLDDSFYEKDILPYIAATLKQRNIDQNNLGDNYNSTNRLAKTLLTGRADTLFRQTLFRQPLATKNGGQLLVTNLDIEADLPWSRIFEIRITPIISVKYQ